MNPISKYISYAEATKSDAAIRHGLANIPTDEQLEAMQHVATNVFDRVRNYFRVAIAITSFFRSPAVNKVIGGSTTSQHCYGEAMDIDGDVLGSVKNSAIFHYIKDNLEFDQLIWEFGTIDEPDWVHVSLKKGINRRQVLRAYKSQGKTVYAPWR